MGIGAGMDSDLRGALGWSALARRDAVRRAPAWRALAALGLAGIGWLAMPANAQVAVRDQGYIPFSDAPINYRSNDLSDPVAKLARQIERGEAQLVYEPEHGYLRSVLNLLRVPVDSQTLVFSKTSFQYPKISPEHPRALYFNDDVYVGSVHEGKAIEIVAFDPRQGAIFYLLDERKVEHPAFQRAELDCTQCHIAAGTRGIPGVLLRSIYPTTTGTLVPGTRSLITDQESPLKERWGGWYVTGPLAGAGHMGNAVVPDKQPESEANAGGSPGSGAASSGGLAQGGRAATGGVPAQGGSGPLVGSQAETRAGGPRLEPLGKPFDAAAYLSAESDVVAHLVLAHQTQMHNLITLTNYKTRLALYSESAGGVRGAAATAGSTGGSTVGSAATAAGKAGSAVGSTTGSAAGSATGAATGAATGSTAGSAAATDSAEAANAPLSEAARRQFERPAEQLLRYLLFVNEAPLGDPDKEHVGTKSAFAQEFAARGPRDAQGRSLRDLDLTTRIFRYPCSYLIYSDSFDALPEPAKGYVYRRLLEVLSGKDQSPDFARLAATDRRSILEILLATKQGLPQEWRDYATANHLRVAQANGAPPNAARADVARADVALAKAAQANVARADVALANAAQANEVPVNAPSSRQAANVLQISTQ